MIKHIVLMRFKKEATIAEITAVFAKLSQLQQSIPQLLNFSGGANLSPENLHQGFLHGFTMDFSNETDRDIYLEHPAHKKLVATDIAPLLEDGYNSVVVFDYELG